MSGLGVEEDRDLFFLFVILLEGQNADLAADFGKRHLGRHEADSAPYVVADSELQHVMVPEDYQCCGDSVDRSRLLVDVVCWTTQT